MKTVARPFDSSADATLPASSGGRSGRITPATPAAAESAAKRSGP